MLGDARRRRQPVPFRDLSSTAQARVHGGALALERPGRRTLGGARPRRPRGAPGIVAPPPDRRRGRYSRATSAQLAPSSRSPASRRTPSLEVALIPQSSLRSARQGAMRAKFGLRVLVASRSQGPRLSNRLSNMAKAWPRPNTGSNPVGATTSGSVGRHARGQVQGRAATLAARVQVRRGGQRRRMLAVGPHENFYKDLKNYLDAR